MADRNPVTSHLDSIVGHITKGPEDRVRELQSYRQQVVAKIRAGKDPEGRTVEGLQDQLQSIDHEIRRLTPPPGGWR
jgi:hypothetical protein